jgi:hypothetical protein
MKEPPALVSARLATVAGPSCLTWLPELCNDLQRGDGFESILSGGHQAVHNS